MASIQANGSKGHHKFILEVNQTSQNIANNTSTVSFTFKIAPIQTTWNWEQWGAYIKYSITINGLVYSGSIDAYDGYSTVTLKSGNQTFSHNADGTKSIAYSFTVTDTSGVNYTSGNASASGSLALTTIPRASTVSGGSGNIGSKTTITISRASSNFTHNLTYYFGNLTGTIATGVGNSYEWTIPTSFYAQIPNANSGTGTIMCETYNGSTLIGSKSVSFTAKVTNSNPTYTASNITYADTNTTVTAITGNNQHIVQNKSNLKVTYTSATGKNSATIKSYSFTLNGVTKTSTSAGGTIDFGVINSASNLTLTSTVTDSRGNTTSATKTITMLAHSNPSAIVTLERLNNYEDETYLTVDGSIASVNSKNKMTIQYRYKVSGGSYNSLATISDNTKVTLSLPKANSYIFNIVVTDSFGATSNKEYALNKGTFPLFIDTVLNSVGINHLPINENALEIAGDIYTDNIHCKNKLYTPYTESNKLTDTATRDDYTVRTNQYCYLEAGKQYTFSCKTDATWGGSTSTDTVEVFLLKDNAYDLYISINTNPKTFTVTETGYYFIRYDINKNGVTHSFWDMQIEEGSVATEFVEGKEFSNKQSYRLGEQHIGTWVDGKPIYKKTVSLTKDNFGTTEVTTGQVVEISHNIKNIKDIIKFEEIWNRNGQYRKFPSNYYANAGWDGHYYCTNQKIIFELGNLAYNRLVTDTIFLYVTIYYTKTTDQ